MEYGYFLIEKNKVQSEIKRIRDSGEVFGASISRGEKSPLCLIRMKSATVKTFSDWGFSEPDYSYITGCIADEEKEDFPEIADKKGMTFEEFDAVLAWKEF